MNESNLKLIEAYEKYLKSLEWGLSVIAGEVEHYHTKVAVYKAADRKERDQERNCDPLTPDIEMTGAACFSLLAGRIVALETSLAATRSELLEMKVWVKWKKGE
jgi:hypothetical protein